MEKGSEKVDMPVYVKVDGVAYMRADLAHELLAALERAEFSLGRTIGASQHTISIVKQCREAIDKIKGAQ